MPVIASATAGATAAVAAQLTNKLISSSTQKHEPVRETFIASFENNPSLSYLLFKLHTTPVGNGNTAGRTLYWEKRDEAKAIKDIPNFFGQMPVGSPFLFALPDAPLTEVRYHPKHVKRVDDTGQPVEPKLEANKIIFTKIGIWTPVAAKKYGKTWSGYMKKIVDNGIWRTKEVTNDHILDTYNKIARGEEPTNLPKLGIKVRASITSTGSTLFMAKHGDKITMVMRAGLATGIAAASIKAISSLNVDFWQFVHDICAGVNDYGADQRFTAYTKYKTIQYKFWVKMVSGIAVGWASGEIAAFITEKIARCFDNDGTGQIIRKAMVGVGSTIAVGGLTFLVVGGGIFTGVALLVGGVVVAWKTFCNYKKHEDKLNTGEALQKMPHDDADKKKKKKKKVQETKQPSQEMPSMQRTQGNIRRRSIKQNS